MIDGEEEAELELDNDIYMEGEGDGKGRRKFNSEHSRPNMTEDEGSEQSK